MEKQTCSSIQVLQSDRGGEYSSSVFLDYLNENEFSSVDASWHSSTQWSFRAQGSNLVRHGAIYDGLDSRLRRIIGLLSMVVCVTAKGINYLIMELTNVE